MTVGIVLVIILWFRFYSVGIVGLARLRAGVTLALEPCLKVVCRRKHIGKQEV